MFIVRLVFRYFRLVFSVNKRSWSMDIIFYYSKECTLTKTRFLSKCLRNRRLMSTVDYFKRYCISSIFLTMPMLFRLAEEHLTIFTGDCVIWMCWTGFGRFAIVFALMLFSALRSSAGLRFGWLEYHYPRVRQDDLHAPLTVRENSSAVGNMHLGFLHWEIDSHGITSIICGGVVVE